MAVHPAISPMLVFSLFKLVSSLIAIRVISDRFHDMNRYSVRLSLSSMLASKLAILIITYTWRMGGLFIISYKN